MEDDLQTGRAASQRRAWREAFDHLTAADRARVLAPGDLERLAEAAWWTGRLGECISARERAYAAFHEAGDARRAAMVGLDLVRDYYGKQNAAIATAWLRRVESLLETLPESAEHGHLARLECVLAFEGRGDLDGGLAHARRALEIGTRFGDRDLMALGLQDQGRILVAKGQVTEGLALMDEAAVPAVSGELGPRAIGIIYCNIISACRNLAEYRRAGEWSEAAKRWCERQAITGFPGICRVYRAEIMLVRGEWAEAEGEVRRAWEELREFNLPYAAEALYELGEVRRRLGDLEAAADAFRQAHALGREPQPGLALLRLTEGKTEAALASIRDAVADEPVRLERARLLPALVEVALAAGRPDAAREAVAELEAIAGDYGTRALEAAALCARGALQLAEGAAADARQTLRRGWRLWRDAEAPYEAARARAALAAACRAEGDLEAARLELDAAKAVFERLGALPDARLAADRLDAPDVPPRLSAAPSGAPPRTFMFTDIVRSTALVEAIGDAAWDDLVRWHDETLRALFLAHGGEEIDHAGDGFFVAFGVPAAALACALAIQRGLAEHRRAHGFAPQVRIGLHAAAATRGGRGYRGKGVHQAARIAALAEAGEIVASEETLRALPERAGVSRPRTVSLKGLSEPVTVVTIDWQAAS